MGKRPYVAVLVKALRELEATDLPVILPVRVLDHLIALAEISHPGLFSEEERESLAYAKAQSEHVRLLLAGGTSS